VEFAVAHGVRHQGYSHLVVATMAVVMFRGMCRYNDESGLLWSNIRFESDRSGFETTFDKRKNAQFCQVNKALVASSPLMAVCHMRLLRELQISTGGAVFCTCFVGLTVDWSSRTRVLRRLAQS